MVECEITLENFIQVCFRYAHPVVRNLQDIKCFFLFEPDFDDALAFIIISNGIAQQIDQDLVKAIIEKCGRCLFSGRTILIR